jgi:guanylate kinase
MPEDSPRDTDFLIVSGPSCAGKSPLCDAAKEARPDLFENRPELIPFHSRTKRAQETEGEDYFFRTRPEIEALRDDDGYVVYEVRDDLQAIELGQIEEKLGKGRLYYEGNFRIALDLQERYRDRCVSVFVSPLTGAEMEEWSEQKGMTVAQRVTELMRRRLLRRTHFQKEYLALTDLESIESRAEDAIRGLRHAHELDYVLPNHDGEDSDHWRIGEAPIGDARIAVEALVAVLAGESHPRLEQWEPGLVPEG